MAATDKTVTANVQRSAMTKPAILSAGNAINVTKDFMDKIVQLFVQKAAATVNVQR